MPGLARGPEAASGSGPGEDQPEDKREERDSEQTKESPEEAPEMVTGHVVKDGKRDAGLEAQLAERTADLQRLQAEYANYRKRVDRDRAAVREQAVVGTLAGLIPVLDAIDQAREHGELSGGFEKVAESLQSALGKLGLVAYGEKGDPFDPNIHEALTGFPFARGHRGHVRRDPVSRLQGRGPDPAARQGRRRQAGDRP